MKPKKKKFNCQIDVEAPAYVRTARYAPDCKTSNDVRCRDLGSEESTREEVGYGGNEDVKMDGWSHQAGQNWE